MKTINGIYSAAELFTTNNVETSIEDYALAQLQMLCDNPTSEGCSIKVMPDVHPGIVGTIGLTMTVGNKLMPNLVGVDIGCGMTIAKLKNKKLEFQQVDKVIRENIPSGLKVRNHIHHKAEDFDLRSLYCYRHINESKARLSLGTLGSGNHFIEIDKDDENDLYVVIHSGSRHLGVEITEYYLSAGSKALKEKGLNIPYELTYLEGDLLQKYLHDLQTAQQFAQLNRDIILAELEKGLKLKITDKYSCIHNYVDARGETLESLGSSVLRKGAISALKDEKVIIPINMRDGVILGTGKGNINWNCSAPHGAGRIMKRSDVKDNYTVNAFKNEMKGIYSSCISKDTLDESPFVYRNISDIQEAIEETVDIDKVIRPVYNFKAGI